MNSSQQDKNNKNEYSEYTAYLFDRIQKITNAVYRVTDLLPDKEPLKWAMREKAVSVFSNLISLQNQNFLERNNSFEESESLIKQLVVLFSLFSDDKSASGMNFEILKQEYASINEAILKEKGELDFYKIFGGDKLKNPRLSNGHPNRQQPKQMSDKESIGHVVKHGDTADKAVAKSVKKEPKIKKYSPGQERKEKIFRIIKSKGRVSVGELSSTFANYSEKTIQRDLLEMVGKGLLEKQGDKRWRTYSLKENIGS